MWRFPKPSADPETIKRAASPLVRVMKLCFLQSGVMVVAALVLIWQKSLAAALYDCCRGLVDWIPFLWRYAAYFTAVGRHDTFTQVFAIHTTYLALEILFLLIMAVAMYGHVDFRARNPFGSRSRALALLAVGLGVFVMFLVGDYSIARSSIGRGNLLDLIAMALVLPSANVCIAITIYAEYGTALSELTRVHYERTNASGPVWRER